jgi:hypothetical protein
MATTHKITCYPVGNGDTTQITLSGGRRVLFDFCHRSNAEQDETAPINLMARLRKDLKGVGRNYFDVVAFTHGDSDHIAGSTEFFELNHAEKYQGGDRIKISELWVPAAMLLEATDKDHQQEENVLLRQEARYRLLEGKGILVFSKPQVLMDWLEPKLKERGEPATARDQFFVDAGRLVPGFTLERDGVEFFCHSPFIKHCDDGDIIRNQASLIFNARFLADGALYDYLHVGDATWEELEDIVQISKYHQNEDRLAWDLFNIPHHCSYHALNEEGQKGGKETALKPLVKELLLQGKADAYIVCSSKPIPDMEASYDQVQPPHIQARKAYERYLKEVGGRKFLITMEEPNTKNPEPIVFEITFGGVAWKRSALIGAPAMITSVPPRAGK